ncbi:hypothetical protein JL722_8118 [Aureococcus anophagefferens]|nr:hypothetical protein JL722_8118 [Aureococcus anophagefferens]
MAALAKPAPAGAWPVAEAAGAAAVADLPKLTAKYAEELSWKRHNKFACNFWLSSEARLVESALARLVAYNKRATQKVGAKIAAFAGLVYEAGGDADCAKMDGMALDDDVEDDAMICV